MPHKIGFVQQNGGELAHHLMLEEIMNFTTSNGWTLLRYDISSARRELILKAPGISGTEEIFIGFKAYHDVNADYYNLLVAGFTGYLAGNTFDTQPGAVFSGVPAHNQRIDYWLTMNGQRLVLAMKVGTPVYETCYIGKCLPYGRPSQYPYPVVCAGMLNGEAGIRFSDTQHSMPFKGNRANLKLRTNDGWMLPYCYPWGNSVIAGTNQMRDTNSTYFPVPIEMHDNTSNIWGALDGVYYISGFDNVVENTFMIDGHNYVVIQDVSRTNFTDYIAIRMDK